MPRSPERKSKKRGSAKEVILCQEDLGQDWRIMGAEEVDLSDERPYKSREARQFYVGSDLKNKQSQLLLVLIEYDSAKMAKTVYRETSEGLRPEPGCCPLAVGDEGIMASLAVRSLIGMHLFIFRKGTWLAIFNLWTFFKEDKDEEWVLRILHEQESRL